jgi:diguanylate cyclase (GGDEF)-like protein
VRPSRPRLTFRSKVVLLAVILVTAIQLGTVVPVLHELKQRQQIEADERAAQAGLLYDEYIEHRTQQLTATIGALVYDFPFRQAVAEGDPPTIESVLRNHVQRADRAFELAAGVFELDGTHIASIDGGRSLWPGAAMERYALDPAMLVEPVISIGFIDARPYHAVTFLVEAPAPIAWVTMAVPIDEAFAAEVRQLTRLETTIVGFDDGGKRVFATTLVESSKASALDKLSLGDLAAASGDSFETGGWITRLRPYHDDAHGVYVALQLPMMDVEARYADVRNSVALLALIALLVTTAAAIWLSSKVTHPVRNLVDAAQRMAEGIYSQRIPVESNDEFAVLAQGFNTMQEAIASREREIVQLAHHDSLSGLPTREIVISEMRDAIEGCDRLAVVNFVLHRFDELASSLGHRTADKLVQIVADRLRNQIEDGQILGHLNRQEFMLALPQADLDEAREVVLNIQNQLRSGLAVGSANISLQIRSGIALYPTHGINASELLRCAGIARGHATHNLGSLGVYEAGQEAKSLELIQIVGDFPRALRSGELWVEYQPKVVCESGELVGAEALCRWQHPKFGRLPPDEFIEAIEQAGSISQLTRWVLHEAVTTLSVWRTHGLSISMSVNISANDLIDDELPAHLEALCARHAIDARQITLEVTESAMMHDIDHSLTVIASLRERGFRIAIDDFGTGHSALAQLKRLPVDELKIDKSFVLNIADRRDEAVVRTAIELAHQFGLTAVAEGVEDEAARTRLQQLGCEIAQGFLYSPAIRPHEFVAWARRWAAGEGADIVSLFEPREPKRKAGK